ncbi:beta strand repeat-containing protein [Actinokineospora bangkokensis]|uniref:Chaplin domain-containing protein n=1 Tax=Actinokineospora bangkokensis TaxID=1193682 RepID=A0A1Q9LG91_9PSEU|nr:chaplin family protein [Actinokineospora bangkokensis]OLR91025.1 hypothetical protein BJP25_31265 [Actinokineospora bangkokensis]
MKENHRMQTWAKRGLQTALFTGGLLMLGTGIASADEDVNPDRPASALDATITVPIHIDNNAIGTPLGQLDVPSVNRTLSISPSEVIEQLPGGDRLLGALAPVANGVTEKAAALDGDGGLLRGNKVVGDLTVPVDISGNAIALGGDVHVDNTSTQTAGQASPIQTDGSGDSLAGNVLALDWAAPVQVTGNAVGLIGDASTNNTATQEAVAGGSLKTSGQQGVLAGNAGAVHAATPVQLNGNAIAGLGKADANSTTASSATSGGVVVTNGQEGVASGNAAALPVALPVHATGQAIGLVGIANAESANTAGAQAGATEPDFAGNPTYVHTYAPDAVLSGNILQPAAAAPTTVDCTSGGAVTITNATCTSETSAVAGGGNRSDGQGGVISGGIGTLPVGTPVDVIGSVATVIGKSTADDTNDVTASAGGASRTRGHDSVLGGALVSTPVAGPVDACGTGAAVAGTGLVNCANTITTGAGGDTATTGDDSIGGGNGAIVPIAVPVETIGNVGGALSTTEVTGSEDKETAAGGDNNTADDGAVLGANLVQAPLATPVQVFGNALGAVSRTKSATELDNTTTAGGYSRGSGIGGVLSGNLAQAPGALPVQVFGANGVVGGIGSAEAANTTTTTSGAEATTDGTGGTGSGNIISAPIASAAQVFGDSVAALGKGTSTATNLTDTTAAGAATTSGESGTISGNVISPALLPIVQAMGISAAAVGGQSSAESTSSTTGSSGGDITTTGDGGFLSGNLLDVPAAVLAQAHGDAIAAIASQAAATSDNTTGGTVGGHSETSGESSDLSGLRGVLPVKVDAPIYDVPLEILADAVTDATHTSDVQVGDQDQQPLSLPVEGALPLTKAPTVLAAHRAAPVAGLPAGALLGGLPQVTGLLGGLPVNGLAGNGVGARAERPAVNPLTGLAALPTGNLTGALPTGNLAGGLPTGNLTGALPTGNLAGGLPTGNLTGALPTGNLTGALPTGNLVGGATGGLVSGTLPGVSGLTGRATGSRAQTPAMPGLVPAAGVFSGNLFEAPEVHTLPATGGSALTSLTDTQSKLADLFGHFPAID